MDEIETSVNMEQAAVVPQEPTVQEGAGESTKPETANQVPLQTEEQNRAFAELRREAQRAKKADAIIAKIYAEHGIKSIDELETALQKQEQEAQKAQYKQQGIDPDIINKLIEDHPIVKEAKLAKEEATKQAEFNKQADELFKEFPKLNAKDVPMEVLKMNAEQGIPLVVAYKAYAYSNVKQTAEQEAIKGLKQNSQTTPGSLSSESTPVSKLPKAGTPEFKALLKRVEAGEVTDLSQI